MKIECEATFPDGDKTDIRNRLQKAGATLIRPEFMQRRYVYTLPKGHEIEGGWVRIRDEGNKITMSLKVISGSKIEDQKESMLIINDMEEGRTLLQALGCKEKAFQESKRELWELEGTEVTIDEWPFLEPYVEVEGPDEEIVKAASEKLGFKWEMAIFGAVHILINNKYGVPFDVINNKTPLIKFDGDNPWLNWKDRV